MRFISFAAVAVLILATTAGCASEANDHVPPSMVAALTAAAIPELEADAGLFGAELEKIDGVADRLCDAEPIGTEPANPTNITQVTVVYVWGYCAERLADGNRGGEMIFPAAVHLTGTDGVQVAAEGDSYSSDLKRLFPGKVYAIATDQAPDADTMIQSVDARADWPPR